MRFLRFRSYRLRAKEIIASRVNLGDQDRIDRIDIPPVKGEPFLDLDAAEPGVEQQLDAAGFNVDAIAVAAGLEGDDPHTAIVPHDGLSCG